MGEIPQTVRDQVFAKADLEEGCEKGIYEEISPGEASRITMKGNMISSAFVVWQQDGEGVEKGGLL